MFAGRSVCENAAADNRVIQAAGANLLFGAPPPHKGPSLDQVEHQRSDRTPSHADRRHVEKAARQTQATARRERIDHAVVFDSDDRSFARRTLRHAGSEDHVLSALDRGLERLATSDVAPNDVDGVAELRARQHLVTRERADREPITEQAWHDLGALHFDRLQRQEAQLANRAHDRHMTGVAERLVLHRPHFAAICPRHRGDATARVKCLERSHGAWKVDGFELRQRIDLDGTAFAQDP